MHSSTPRTRSTAGRARSSILRLGLWLGLTFGAATGQAGIEPPEDPALDQIVMLCATEPGSPRFDQAWTVWLADHDHELATRAEVNAVIDAVVSRAHTLRSMAAVGMEPVRPGSRPSRQQIVDHMQRLAGTADH